MANVRPPKVPEPRTQMLTRTEMKSLLAGAAGKDFVSRRDTAIILLLADTGMRRMELAALAVDDLDLRGRVVEVAGKGDREHRKRYRLVPFGPPPAQPLDPSMGAGRVPPGGDSPSLWLAEKNRGVLTADGIRQMLERRG